MNEKKLQNAVKQITLPEESKQKFIRKLDMISQEEHVFQAESTKLPIFRYVITGVVACAVLAVSTGGLFQLTRTQSEIQSEEQFTPGSEMIDFDFSSEEQIYVITQESDTQYFTVSESDTRNFLEYLQTVLTSHIADFQTEFMVGGSKEFIICLQSGWFEFWKDGDDIFMLIENFEEQTYCVAISPEEYETMKIMLANPEEYFDLPYENQDTVLYGDMEETIIDYMFQEKISPFGDVTQMQERFIFVEYAPLYLIPTEEQHQKFADLLHHAEWEKITDIDTRILDLYEGQFFTVYFDSPEERFTVKFQLSGYIMIENTQEVYENQELVSEIHDLFVPSDTLYELNPADALYELNQEQIFEQMFDNEPIEFQQIDNTNFAVVQIPDTPVLIHDETFSRNTVGDYELEEDIQYTISQEQKLHLSDFIASQELQAIAGYPDFQRADNYQKFVVELTEENAFFTVEYDIEHQQYYFILCSQMEAPGEPVETGEYCYFPVTEDFYQNWNTLLANPEN